MHNERMLNKVVLYPSRDGSARLKVSQAGQVPAKTIPGSELHLGTQDLIRFADYAQGRGFKVIGFMIADSYLVPLDDDDQESISEDLAGSLNLYGVNVVEAAMNDEYSGLYLIGVNLIDLSRGLRISVRRRGFVDTTIVEEAEQLLQSAWKDLKLS